MKELFSAFGSEVFRPLMTLAAPGAVALTPWIVGLMQRYPEFSTLIDANHTESAFLLTLAALMVGMLLEDVGSTIEVSVFDRALNEATAGQHSLDWNKYLRIGFRIEPVGVRYIRAILLRMKFELAMGTAAIISGVGSFATTLSIGTGFVVAASGFGLAAILFREARSGHAILSKTRRLLLEGLIVVGDSSEQEPAPK